MAKFLDTPEARILYGEYARAEINPPVAKRALDALAQAHCAPGEPNWVAMNKALNSKLGRELYRKAAEVA